MIASIKNVIVVSNVLSNINRLNQMNVLIADSGGTKTDWAFLRDGETEYISGKGLHPAYMTTDQMTKTIEKVIGKIPDQIFFYGAGCHGLEPQSKIKRAFWNVFSDADVEVTDDLTGASRAHLQNTDGIIVALGTGSICGRYKSGDIVQRSASLGYAIGDEGSAADFGRTILKAYFRNTLNSETEVLVDERLAHMSYSGLMEQIYSSDRPNKQLAAIAGNVLIQPLTEELRELIMSRFGEFIDAQFYSLVVKPDEEIICTGSVAVAHADIFTRAMALRGFKNIRVKKGVIEGLVQYHKSLK